jgi:hypothetical protein
MLAYDMNDETSSFGHGAPLRLRNEIELLDAEPARTGDTC